VTREAKNGGVSAEEEQKLARAVDRVRSRRDYWERTGEMPLGRALGMIGKFGWAIVGPSLLGAFAGRWLDRTLGTGVFWSATLVLLGVAVGFYMVWKGMHAQ